jgi:hypothetical protein
MSKELTPDLKSKAGPVKLSRHSMFQAEHRQHLIRNIRDLRPLNLHSWPRPLNKSRELFKAVVKVIPVVAKVSGRAMGHLVSLNRLFSQYAFLMLHRPKYWNDGKRNWKILSDRDGTVAPVLKLKNEAACALPRKEQE